MWRWVTGVSGDDVGINGYKITGKTEENVVKEDLQQTGSDVEQPTECVKDRE